MGNKTIHLTSEAIRKAYVEEHLKSNQNAEAFACFTETELADFIRRHVDSNFSSIYTCTDHNFYDHVRNMIAINTAMREEDDAIGLQYSVHLRTYSQFLESKAFKQLLKQKINIEGSASNKHKSKDSSALPNEEDKTEQSQTSSQLEPKDQKSTAVQTQERQMTEGEKKHVEFETAHRNQKLRQACLNKYGYQCQCCGMDFASLYGDELGANFIEVHHLQMISTYDENRPEDYLENLVPLCSNCHSMIHHGKEGPLSLRELRAAYKGEKKEIKIWKED